MCGIYGIVIGQNSTASNQQLKRYFTSLSLLSESRGKEAAGMMAVTDKKITISKEPIPTSEYIKTDQYSSVFESSSQFKCLVGHSRLATNGLSSNNANNQPIRYESFIGVHNGIVTNSDTIWETIIHQKNQTETDSEIIMALLNMYYPNYGLRGAAVKTYKHLEGAASIAVVSTLEKSLLIATNTGSLYTLENQVSNHVVFASEKYILAKWMKDKSSNGTGIIKQVTAGTGIVVEYGTLKKNLFNLNDVIKKSTINAINDQINELSQIKSMTRAVAESGKVTNNLGKLKKHKIDYQWINGLKRCTKCILPETTPFIHFNQSGVCNYCLNHHPFTYHGLKAIKKQVKQFKSSNGQADCLVGFSGGRDSSYGLYFIKKILGLNPIAYTYDWGMMTDLGRQNASRVTAALGVEHIIVSADMAKKRQNIAKNILAWIKKPDLGMVPLFMAGDKESEFHMNQLRKKTGIDLVLYCRGNQYEREEFKAGLCGVADADPGGVIHDLSLGGKIKMAQYYIRQFATNTSYINNSIVDTAWAYWCTYFLPHQYLYLYHYIPWNEQVIIATLKEECNWQSPNDNPATWRIDDASPAFYNYIYYQIQGFTEHDSLRSHQIRQGEIDREQALNIVYQENQPRYGALKWYFDAIKLDGDMVLSVIDKMPKVVK
jgi:glutamine---fructose-6-phosphate transaminase (isomerizing)